MTLNEIAYNLLNLIRGGRSNHDEHISLEQLKFNVRYYRAMFIRRDYIRNGLITRHLEQDLGCLKLIKVDASKCCALDAGCDVFRTELTVPKTVRFNFEDAITYVGAVDGLTRIPLITPQIAKWVQYDKYTGTKKKAYMIEDYLYILNPNGMEYVNVRGIFENPEDVAEYDCDGDCYNDDMEYPIPLDMLSAINMGIMQGELNILGNTMSDTTADRTQVPQQTPRVAPPQEENTQQ
tara:strand:+ start:49 stop:756 length:708 start_codon:yes stop_codon:yes gene_type:complete